MEMNAQTNATPKKHSSAYGENFKHLFEGVHFRFPKYRHDHPAVINVNEVADERMTLGQRVADAVASGMGSWRFIIIQTTILVLWAVLNSVGWWSWKWDASWQVLDRWYVAIRQVERLFCQLCKVYMFGSLVSDRGHLS
jgi:hypothetical protein